MILSQKSIMILILRKRDIYEKGRIKNERTIQIRNNKKAGGGKWKVKTCRKKLNRSERTINLLIRNYEKQGKAGFIHRNRGRKLSCAFDANTKHLIIDLYKTKYSGSNVKHFTELLAKQENISVCDTTVRNWLYEENILSPKRQKRKRERN